MTSGKDCPDDAFEPNDNSSVLLTGFKIRQKSVLRSLKKLDPNKSAVGVGPRFLKECSTALAPALTKLFQFVVKKAVFPSSSWKCGRVAAVHKRGKVSIAKNYRPVRCIDNIELAFEDVIMPQLEKWLLKFISQET